MYRAVLGQAVGIASISSWLGLTVFCMSKAATPNASDSGNWFILFALITCAFIAIMAFWRRMFGEA